MDHLFSHYNVGGGAKKTGSWMTVGIAAKTTPTEKKHACATGMLLFLTYILFFFFCNLMFIGV